MTQKFILWLVWQMLKAEKLKDKKNQDAKFYEGQRVAFRFVLRKLIADFEVDKEGDL